ncbi:MAG: PDZ domain-containing protein, partial [Candidatus Omnitrophica bacterium]|nr:PDZ domain-containing protein [Candidatus Omnitrophota bacterium]
ADLYLFNPSGRETQRIDIDYPSPRTQRNRKFVEAAEYMSDFNLHPEGHSLAVETRGKLFTMPLWEEAVKQYGRRDGVRYRLGQWLPDGKTLVVVSDQGGEETLELFSPERPEHGDRMEGLDLGRPIEMKVCPDRKEVVLSNHRMELLWVNLEERKVQLLDRCKFGRIEDCSWSPDGNWVAYSFAATHRTRSIKLCHVPSGKTHFVTRPEFRDVEPAFDPDGKYLYFLSYRTFDPVYDNHYFDLNFPRGMRPYLVTLQKDTTSPFLPGPKGFGGDKDPQGRISEGDTSLDPARSAGGDVSRKKKPVQIDLEGIEDRVTAFPAADGLYSQISGLPGKVLYLAFPVEGSLGQEVLEDEDDSKGSLMAFDFEDQKAEVLIKDVIEYRVSADNSTLLYRTDHRLRALKAGEKPDEEAEKDTPSRKTGWIHLGRIRVSVNPPDEWNQMYREAWRLQRDHFWVADMSGVDWERVYQRYLPLLDKVASRTEFSDLMWEMQGELGTSHAYELGGDYRPVPQYRLGHLAADLRFEPDRGAYVFSHIVKGDSWDTRKNSPLRAPGAGIAEGDALLAIGGRRLGPGDPPGVHLVNQAGLSVELTVAGAGGGQPRTVVVKTLGNEMPARYREWVEQNRRRVHEASDGRVGYVHIPNMGPLGYSEFHRYYLSEVDHEALLVDVRFNGGGNVSQLILEKLLRRRIGYDLKRWGAPEPYPSDSVFGPVVALTNELAGSDGDIFSHCFKLMKIGPLVGKRTWGGVIGICPTHGLVDGSLTTQPEYSFWFVDVGWGVENYGTDPDIEVDNRPQDYAAGKDAQLAKALEVILQKLEESPPQLPQFNNRPVLSLPGLPPRV